MADEKKLRILIEAILKEKGFKDAEQALQALEKQTEKAGEATKEAGENLDGMLEKTTSLLGSFGMVVTVLGGGMTPIIKSAQQYVETVQLANDTSREWLATTYQIEKAQTQLGKVNAEFLTPIYSKWGDFVEKLGDLAEKNPIATIAAEFTGGAVGAVGGANVLAGILGKIGLGSAAGAVSGGAAGVASVLPAVPIVATEIIADKKLRENALKIVEENEAAGNERVDPSKLSGAQLFAYAIGAQSDPYWSSKQWQTPEEAEKAGVDEPPDEKYEQPFWDKLVASFKQTFSGITTTGNVVEPSTQRAMFAGEGQKQETGEPAIKKTFWEVVKEFFENPSEGLKDLFSPDKDAQYGTGQSSISRDERLGSLDKTNFMTMELTQAMMQFRKQELLAQEDYNRSYSYAVEDFNRNRLYQEEDYNRQRTIAYRNFAIQQAQSERMFYLQRSIAQRDFQISQQRADYDYHKGRARAEEDYNFSLKQIMLSGDALAYYYAKRQHEIDVRRAEEDYQLQRQRAQEDFNRSQADSLMFFGIQREFARQQFEISMEDRELEYQIMRDRAQSEFYDVTLKRMQDEYRIMADRRLQSFYESIVPAILHEDELKLYYQSLYLDASVQGYVSTAIALQNYFNDIVEAYSNTTIPYWTPPSYGPQMLPGMASGGYAEEREYQLHEHEFVLTRNSTERLEQMLGGRLTQEKVSGLASMRDIQVSEMSQGKLTPELLISMMAGLRKDIVYNDNRQFSRGISVDEKIQLKQELRQMVIEAFR